MMKRTQFSPPLTFTSAEKTEKLLSAQIMTETQCSLVSLVTLSQVVSVQIGITSQVSAET